MLTSPKRPPQRGPNLGLESAHLCSVSGWHPMNCHQAQSISYVQEKHPVSLSITFSVFISSQRKGNNAFCKPNVLQLPKWVCWRRILTSLQNASFLPIGMLVKQVQWCGGFIAKCVLEDCIWHVYVYKRAKNTHGVSVQESFLLDVFPSNWGPRKWRPNTQRCIL